jgi:hypothetical protein
MAGIGADDVTFEDLANLYEESQDGLADLFLQDVPFYNLVKTEQPDDLDISDTQVMCSFSSANRLHVHASALTKLQQVTLSC